MAGLFQLFGLGNSGMINCNKQSITNLTNERSRL